MSWWKILMVYLLFLGGLLWFLRRSRVLHEEPEDAPGD
jgi:hypothetical protein